MTREHDDQRYRPSEEKVAYSINGGQTEAGAQAACQVPSTPAAPPQPMAFGVIPLKLVALGCLVLQTTTAVILTRYSRILRSADQPQYDSATVVVVTEVMKFVLSMALVLLMDTNDNGQCSPTKRMQQFWLIFQRDCFEKPLDTAKVLIPAVLYTIQNNLVYIALSNLEATTFQVGYQSKVVTCAVLSVVMLGRKLSLKSWIALFSLTGGIVLTQLEGKAKTVLGLQTNQNFLLGVVAVIGCSFCSAFAGVYFEKILKGTEVSLWVRNTQLAGFSVICGLFGTGNLLWNLNNFFEGWDALVWSLVLIQALGGLIVAVVVKYADNIMKGFAAALSIVLCGFTSVNLFGFAPTASFLMGSVVVIGATLLYSTPDRK